MVYCFIDLMRFFLVVFAMDVMQTEIVCNIHCYMLPLACMLMQVLPERHGAVAIKG